MTKPNRQKKPIADIKPRKIALLGTASTSAMQAPYEDPSWEIWNHSGNWVHNKRFDVYFELHSVRTLKEAGNPPGYFEFLKANSDKLVVGHPNGAWQTAKLYPLQEITELFPRKYFTSSMSFMIAMAILTHINDKKAGGNGIAELGLWGVDMITSGEYAHQKGCCEYYLGVAETLGIKITLPFESPILRCNAMYAFDNLKMAEEMTGRLREANTNAERARIDSINLVKAESYATGARDALKSFAEYWSL